MNTAGKRLGGIVLHKYARDTGGDQFRDLRVRDSCGKNDDLTLIAHGPRSFDKPPAGFMSKVKIKKNNIDRSCSYRFQRFVDRSTSRHSRELAFCVQQAHDAVT